MQDQENATLTIRNRAPWNNGKLTGAKPPLRPKHVWCIRAKLQIEGRVRDLAMFNLAIDGKLRGCDVVVIKVDDVAAGGYTADRATVRQKKTGRPVSSKNFDAPHQNHSAEARNTESHWTKFLWIPDAATRFFTLWIAAFTVVLVLSPIGLWIATNRTAKASERMDRPRASVALP